MKSTPEMITETEAIAHAALDSPTQRPTDPAPNNENIGGARGGHPMNGQIDHPDAYAGRIQSPASGTLGPKR